MAKKTSSSGDDGAATGPDHKPYVVLARQYRPQSFADLIGQDAMVTTLRNAFAASRIAQAYMLTGVRGVGKTTTARILARGLNYETDTVDRPAIDMPTLGVHCRDIMDGRHPDVIEMDAASNTGIDNIREVIESVQYTPILARTKVFIIDEVHMLSKGAFNALLKTLEEPPAHVKFIFATTEIRKVPVTVLSRCQRFDLRRVEQSVLVKHFRSIAGREDASAEDDALALIARAAEGSVRDGLSILDQAIAMGAGDVTAAGVRAMLGLADRARIFDLAEAVMRGDVAGALQLLAALHRDGAEAAELVADLAEAIHIIARIKAVGEEPSGDGLSFEEKQRGLSLASRLSTPYLARAWQMLLKGHEETMRAPRPLAAAEMLLIRLAHTADLPAPDEIIRTLGGGARSAGGKSAPLSAPVAEPPAVAVADTVPAHLTTTAIGLETGEPFKGDIDPDIEAEGDGDDADPVNASVPGLADPRSFSDVVALAGLKRDAKLKLHLEDDVSLVGFDAVAGAIDLHLLAGAPPEMANELREKLNAWTSRRWVVVLSGIGGAPTIGAVRREREAAELESLKTHPAVKAVFDAFPGAKVVAVRPLHSGQINDTDESAAG